MDSQTDSYERLLTKAADLYAEATGLFHDEQYVKVYGYNEINVLLRRGEFLLKLAELSRG